MQRLKKYFFNHDYYIQNMKKKSRSGVPEPSIRRLPTYLNHIRKLEGKQTYISSTGIARELILDSTQVTKDIAYTGITGKTRLGYKITELINSIEEFLGFRKTNKAFIVGTGRLGAALMGYSGFDQKGLKIIAGFDIDPNLVDSEIENIKVLHLSKIKNIAERMHVNIGIIATPASESQAVVNIMVEAGIRAIWNFSPTHLKVPDSVVVENSSIYPNLALLFNKMKKQNDIANTDIIS